MGLYNWIWDWAQDGKIEEQSDKVEALEKRVEILEQWIRYYEQSRRPQEACREGWTEAIQTEKKDENR